MLVADGFDQAILGIARRCGQPDLVAYSVTKCLEVLMREGMTYEVAVDYFQYNTAGAWVGEETPVWVYDAELVDQS